MGKETWDEVAKAIRGAGGKAWDDVADPEAYLTRELTALACESVKRDGVLAKLEAEVIASRDIVVKAVARAEELERLVRAHRKAEEYREKCSKHYDEAIKSRNPDACDAAGDELERAGDAVDRAIDALFAAVPEASAG